MNELEHARQRLFVLEDALRAVMATVTRIMPPAAAEQINRIGLEWDKTLDALDARVKSTSPAREPGALQGGEK